MAGAHRGMGRGKRMSAEDLSSAPGFRVSDLIRHGVEPPPVALLTRWPSYPWLIIGVTCIGAFMGQVDASIVQLALPTLGRVFDCTLESVSWVALAYLLGVAAFMPIFAQLCQIFGRKLLYIIGFVVFTGASALCGFAPDLPTLVVFRFLQGFGGAMLGANSMALVVTSTDKSLRARALGVYAGAQAVGISAGPVIGGLLLGTLGWPWVFWINVPFGLLAVVFGWLVLPITAQQNRNQTFDWRGGFLLAPALAFAVLALNQVSAWGLTSPALLGSVGAAIVLIFLFLRQEHGARSPLIDLRCLMSRRFSPERWPALFRTPCFTGCSSSLHSRLCAATRRAPSPRGSSSRSFRSASESSRHSPGDSRIGWGRVSSASRGWRYASSPCSR